MWKGLKTGFGAIIGVWIGLTAIQCINDTLDKEANKDTKEEKPKTKTLFEITKESHPDLYEFIQKCKAEMNKEESVEESEEEEAQ